MKRLNWLFAGILITALVAPSTAVLAQDGDGLITNYTSNTSEISHLDPQMGEDAVSINAIENLFLGLTDYDPINPGVIRPELATSWEISDDAMTFTFHLRDDVMWVRYDPDTGDTDEVRPVVAGDVVNGVRRACDPNLGTYYATVVAPAIVGCNEVLELAPEEGAETVDVPAEMWEAIGVSAPDDTTVVFELAFPAGYFLSMSAIWTLRAVPMEVIEANGAAWIEPGTIITNGPFVIESWERGVSRTFVRNPYFPEDMLGPGNVDRIHTVQVEDTTTQFALYLDNAVDASNIPLAEVDAVRAERPEEIVRFSDLAVGYMGFGFDQPPFDDARVRRAFSAAIDREAFVNIVYAGNGLPWDHFAPPGMFGAVAPNWEFGVGTDIEFAQAQLAEAGYPNCEGFPSIDIAGYSGSRTATWLELLASNWEENLGCAPELLNIEQAEFSVLLQLTAPDAEERVNIWTAFWGPDYPDNNNWVGDVLWCESSSNRFLRPCTEADDLLVQARVEGDPEVRMELYEEIEALFFSADGEFPIAPLILRINEALLAPWYDAPVETDVFGGVHWDWRTIDPEAQAAARSN